MSILLRPFTREEYHDFWRRYVPDPIMDARPYRYVQEHVECSFRYDLTRRDWYPVFGIFTEDGVVVGTLSLKRIDRQKRQCELGIMMVNDSCKNRGYGTEAIRQAIEIAHEQYGVEHLLADTMGSNLRMQHLLGKLGFRFLERTENVYDMNGRMEDRLDYVLDITKAR
ncbi:MAG: GNAT family N-acetyltransferase [Aristaeellaceae bacterium]